MKIILKTLLFSVLFGALAVFLGIIFIPGVHLNTIFYQSPKANLKDSRADILNRLESSGFDAVNYEYKELGRLRKNQNLTVEMHTFAKKFSKGEFVIVIVDDRLLTPEYFTFSAQLRTITLSGEYDLDELEKISAFADSVINLSGQFAPRDTKIYNILPFKFPATD